MEEPLETWIEEAAELLPGQGPITVFIHHNTLHALEGLPFEEAVVGGGRLLGCEPYLAEDEYREMIGAGRIRVDDLEDAVRKGCEGGADSIGRFVERSALRLAWLRHGIPEVSGTALLWVLKESDALTALRADLSAPVRARLLASSAAPEAAVVDALWNEALRAVARSGVRSAPAVEPHPVRHRDLLRPAGSDPDERVHPLLIRLCAAYLDQGLASWPMPNREEGFFRAVTTLYAQGFGPPGAFMGRVRELMREEVSARRTPHESIERSLEELGVEAAARPDFLAASLLALRGWAGMMRQVERRPDRMPAHAPPASLADFLAVRLLLDRAAIAESLKDLSLPTSCRRLDALVAERAPERRSPTAADRAWPLFHLSQLLGKTPAELAALEPSEVGEVLAEIDAFDTVILVRRVQTDVKSALAYASLTHVSLILAAIGPRPAGGIVRLDSLSALLIPFVAALWGLAVGIMPRASLDRRGLRRTAVSTLVHVAIFSTESPTAIVVLWTASIVVLIQGLRAVGSPRAVRLAGVFLGASVPLLAAGAAFLEGSVAGSRAATAGSVCVLLAVMIRAGIVPLHLWILEALDHGRLGPVVLFCAPQVGAYVAIVMLLPAAPRGLLTAAGLLALFTAVYGALAAIVQRDARRAFGYVFVSQSSLVVAGLECVSASGLTGGLCLWLSSGVAFAALARCLSSLESRRGRLSLADLNGGYERMPLLATSFLLTALASIGFPGTFGFVGHEFLVQGTVERYPRTGFLVIAASAFGAIALLRAYFSLFCGRTDRGVHLGVRPRERMILALVSVMLIVAGLAPGPLLVRLHDSSARILAVRGRVTATRESPPPPPPPAPRPPVPGQGTGEAPRR